MSYYNLPQSNINRIHTDAEINERFSLLSQQTIDFFDDIHKKFNDLNRRIHDASSSNLASSNSSPSNLSRDLEKERIAKLKSTRNKAIIFGAVLITCIAVNILLCIFLPIPQKILSVMVFTPFYYFLSTNFIAEIKDYKNLQKT